MQLHDLISDHKDDFADLALFTAYTAAFPVYRVTANLLVQEATEIDPIDLFVLRGIKEGLESPAQLAGFLGLAPVDVDVSIAEMLHNQWIEADSRGSEHVALSLLPTGRKVLEERLAYSQQVRDGEVWVDGTRDECELRPPRTRLLTSKAAKARSLFVVPATTARPRASGDLGFLPLQASVARIGSDVWPGTKLNLLLDILGVTPRGIAYRQVDVLVFQSQDGQRVEFEAFESGVRSIEFERTLRRLDEQGKATIPFEPSPSNSDRSALEQESELVAAAIAGEPTDPLTPDSRDTRDRMRDEIDWLRSAIKASSERENMQRLVRNQENRGVWIDVLSQDASAYVVMEFPWIRGEALDEEIIDCMRSALARGVSLWLAWGINQDAADSSVLLQLQSLASEKHSGRLLVKYRGDTHRKLLLWDGQAALISSFNFGSFRGDPNRRVRQEIGAIVSAPSAVRDLEDEFAQFFGVSLLG